MNEQAKDKAKQQAGALAMTALRAFVAWVKERMAARRARREKR